MELLAPIVMLAVTAAYVWNLNRRRHLRAGRAMVRRLKALAPGRKKAIQRSIAEGRAVDDVADARFALEWIDYQHAAQWGRHSAIDFAFDALLLGGMTFSFWALDMPRLLFIVLIVPFAFVALLTAALQPFTRRAARKQSLLSLQAREANQRLLEGRQ